MGFCTACGSEIPQGSAFCLQCGAPVQPEPVLVCEGCGAERSSATETFCMVCGHRHDGALDETVQATVVPAAPVQPVAVQSERRVAWIPILLSIAGVLVVIALGVILVGLLGDDDSNEPDVATTDARDADELDEVEPPTVNLSASGRLPALLSSAEVPVVSDSAVGMVTPEVAGSTPDGGTVSFGGEGPAFIILVTVANNDSTVGSASALLDGNQIRGAETILVVSGESSAAIEWVEESGWAGTTLIDNSGSILLDVLGVGLTPHVLAIDADGRVAARASGDLTSGELEFVALAATGGPIGAPGTTTTTSTALTTTTTTTTVFAAREATLYSNFAKVRDEPSIGAREITTLADQDGLRIEVLSTHQQGWYLIRAGEIEGWIFGTFVLPADPGLRIAQTRGGETAELLDVQGNDLGVDNQSGPKVLVTDTTGAYWEVLLPDGGTAWVDPAAMRLVN